MMMTFDEIFETLPTNGWLTREEARLLHDTVKDCQGPILEVGSYHGRSTVLLASLGREVHCVDPFTGFDSDDPTGDVTKSKFLLNLSERRVSNIRLHRKKIEDWFPMFVFGFAYLDGDHTYGGTLRQIDKAIDAGVKTFCIHDYNQEGDGVAIVKAVKDRRLNVIRVVERMAHVRCPE